MVHLFLPGVKFADVARLHDKQINSVAENTKLTVIQIKESFTQIPKYFFSYDDPEWSIQFNNKCLYCTAPVTTKPVFIPTAIESNGRMTPFGVFHSFICAVTYLMETNTLQESYLHNIFCLYTKYSGKIIKHIPRGIPRTEINIFGGGMLLKDYVEKTKNLELLIK